ncbi:flagellar protein FlgN [Rubellimicrobium arenae]|uniref:flagellar protein FlgN n=1 Tax=Rubellimicrobium arenae TaxID=2817372 RepID=UPI001B306A06|nr:flagellar protein FlgN [Rubellimicrobium arenae]
MILTGAWSGLQVLAPRKATYLAALDPEDRTALAALAGGLSRNQALLAAALDGVREALRRRQAMAASRKGLVTYSATGARAELPVAPPGSSARPDPFANASWPGSPARCRAFAFSTRQARNID